MSENGRWEDRLSLTPTHSFILSQITTTNTSFAFLINPTVGHLRDYIRYYATRVSVAISSLIIFQSDIPNEVYHSYYQHWSSYYY